MLILPATAETIAAYVNEADSAPEELSSIANIMPAPPMPMIPAEYHGQLIIMATIVYAGDPAEGEVAIAPFRAITKPVADMVKTMPYPEIFPPGDESFHPTAASYTMFVEKIDLDVAAKIIERLRASEAPMRVAQLRVLGGAMARVPDDATAFAHRSSRIMVNIAAFYEGAQERHEREKWVSGFADAIRQDDTGAYVNFLSDEGDARVHDAYPGPNWKRLQSVKQCYDPTNLFRLNQNIPPDPD